MDAFWIILTGILVGACGAIVGSFLLLRKMSLVGDAISHAVLPGIVIAFLLVHNRNNTAMLLSAALVGLLTTYLIETLQRNAKLPSDAATGLVFTFLFAVGVILISYFAGNVDLDQDCVLYGEILFVPLETWHLPNGKDMGPITVWTLGALLTGIVIFVSLGFKALLITSFDPIFSNAKGISTGFWHYALMAIVSLTTVFSFESVGAILVVAFLVIPAATAFLLTRKLSLMLIIAVLVSSVSSIAGYYVGVWLNASIAGAMATVLGAIFGLVAVSQALVRSFPNKAQNSVPKFQHDLS